MARKPTRASLSQELGSSSYYGNRYTLRADEFLPELRGTWATRKYREMKDNDPGIGAFLMAVEMLMRSASVRFEPADDTPAAEEEAEFVEGIFEDLYRQTLDDFLSDALTFLPFGFSLFEIVYKRRQGDRADSVQSSKFNDGRFGIAKLAPRPQWTIDQFVYDDTGQVVGFKQLSMDIHAVSIEIPLSKAVHFRTTASQGDPAGRSILRNAYTAYHYATHIDMIEAIGIERELNGIPVGRLPAEYLGSGADADQVRFREQFEKMLRNVKFNDQGYVLLPSDLQTSDDGQLTDTPIVGFELMASSGSRAINTGDAVNRHRNNIARSVLAQFLMLGNSGTGSFALSKNQTDLFVSAMQGFAENVASTIDRQIVDPLWRLNSLNPDLKPKTVFADIAPVDLNELGAFIRDTAAAGINLTDPDTENVIREAAGFPEAQEDPDIMGTRRPAPPPTLEPEGLEE